MTSRTLRILLIVLLAALIGWLMYVDQRGHYPYLPQFVSPHDVPPTVLPEPPRPGSREHAKQLQLVIAAQKNLSQAEKDAAMAESGMSEEMMVIPTLGESFTRADYPELYALLERANSDANRIAHRGQAYWQSVRPWLYDKERVKLYVHPVYVYSYPSGHTVVSHVWAALLSDLAPAHRTRILKRADEIAFNRVRGGVHYPSDLAAGRKMAGEIYCKMKESKKFARRFERVKAELSSHAPSLITGQFSPCQSLAAGA